MKVIILKDNLNTGLKIVDRIVGKNLSLPILNNILITAEKNLLNLTTTDLEIGINYWTLGKIEKEGKITIPAKILSNFISSLPNEKLVLEIKNMTLLIEGKNYKSEINGLNSEEFPIIPKFKTEDFIEINSFPFCEGISQVVDFSALGQARPELSGVYFNFQEEKVQIAATDSFRLAEKTLNLEKKLKKTAAHTQEYSFILPQKTTRELMNIFFEKEDKIKIYFSPNQVLFESLMPETSHPQLQLISRLIEGEYPNYQEIIPKKYETQVILEKNEFLNQIKAASLFSGKTNEIKIKVKPKQEEIEIFSQSPEVGENKSFSKGKINGKEVTASFNFRFLMDGLLKIKSREVIFELNGEEGPAVLKPVGDTSYFYVVMPIKGA